MRLLGNVEVRVGDVLVEAFVAPRLQSLLGYLIVHRNDAQSRQRLAFVLWPDSTEAQARTNLRQALHHVRHALPDVDALLRADGRTLQWLSGGSSVVDLIAFEEACARADRSHRREDLECAVSAYGGDLLPGCYDDWVEPERQRVRRRHVAVLERLTKLSEEEGDHRAAVRAAEQLVALDPLDEASCRWLMRLLAQTGQRGRALRVYHECVTTLADGLGVPPSAETVDEYERLVAAPQPRRKTVDVRAPIIGRGAEWQALVECWEISTAGRAQLAVVRGEAGIGKSRLADEFRGWCARQGVSSASSRAYEAEGSMSYAPVIEVLRSAAVRPFLSRLDPSWQVELIALVPELAIEHPELVQMARGAPGDRTRMLEAVARAVTATPGPLVVVIDDLQWCDADTLEFLHFLIRFAADARLLVIATVREEGVGRDHPLRTVLASLRMMGAVVDVPLARLDPTATRALAEQLTGADPVLVERLVRTSGGIPLFLVELARSGLTGQPSEGRLGFAVSPRLQAVIGARLDKLSERAREVAAVAAVVGRPWTIELVGQVATEHDDDDIVAAVDELWSRGIVGEHGNDAYDFTHDLIRDVVYAGIGPATRKRLHLHLARVGTTQCRPAGRRRW